MQKFIFLLKSNILFRRLMLVQFLNFTGGWLLTTAVFTRLIHLEADPFWIGLVGASHFMLGILQAPFVGVLTDRLDPKKTLLSLIAVEIVATIMLLFVNSPELIPLIFFLVLIRMGSASFYFNMKMTILPKIFISEPENLKTANEISAMSWSITLVLGTAFGGLGVAFFGVTTVFIIDILFYLSSFFILFNTKFIFTRTKISDKFFQMLKDGFRYLIANKKVIHLIVLHSVVALTTYESIIALASERYFINFVSVAVGIGFSHAVRGIALMVGAIIFTNIINIRNLHLFFFFQGVFVIFWSFTIENFYYNLFGSFLAGILINFLWSFTYTLIQTETESKFLGRIIAYNDMFFLTIASLTAFLTAEVLNFGVSIQSVIMTIGFLIILGGFYSYFIFKK
jgi:MFS family permease